MTYYKLNTPTVSAEILDNEVLAVNLISGRYYNFKNTGAIFWRFLIDGISEESAIQKISELYSVNLTIVRTDLLNFISELLINDLVIPTNTPQVALHSNWLNTAVGSYSKPLIEIHTDMENLVLLSA